MNRTRRGRLVGAVAVLLLVSGAVTVVTTLPASASKSPVLRANPHKRLTSDDSIQVRGGNFGANDAIVVIECQRDATEPTDCDPATAKPVTANATGHIPPFSFTVLSGVVGTGTCGTSASDAHSCELAANDVTAASTFTATINIGFKPSSIIPSPSPPSL